MSATLVVADKPAPSPGPVAKLEPRLSAPVAEPSQAPALRATPLRPTSLRRLREVPAPAPHGDNPVLSAGRGRPSGGASCSALRSAQQTVARVETPTACRDRRAPGGRAGADRKSRAARPSAHPAGVAGGKSQSVHRQL